MYFDTYQNTFQCILYCKIVKEVNDISIFKTDYIATLNSSAIYGATCLHGDSECKGIHRICKTLFSYTKYLFFFPFNIKGTFKNFVFRKLIQIN